KEPTLERPYRAKSWTGKLALAGAGIFLIAAVVTDTGNSLIALGVVAAAWPIFLIVRTARPVSTS
ncbi:MAG TPA: hypothetical protein VFD85_11155, partial [Gemmatimonadales bacterium]|nr:hypothetical protein [Gemmatimonadales bacterium]